MSRKWQPPEAGREPDFPQSPREDGAAPSDVSAKTESRGKKGGEGTERFPPGKEQRQQTSVHHEACEAGLVPKCPQSLQWTPGNYGLRFLCRLLSKPPCLSLCSQGPPMAGRGPSWVLVAPCPVIGTAPLCVVLGKRWPEHFSRVRERDLRALLKWFSFWPAEDESASVALGHLWAPFTQVRLQKHCPASKREMQRERFSKSFLQRKQLTQKRPLALNDTAWEEASVRNGEQPARARPRGVFCRVHGVPGAGLQRARRPSQVLRIPAVPSWVHYR